VTEGSTQGGSAVPQIAGFHPHAVLTAGGWQALAIIGTLAIMAAGVLIAWRATRLPVMSSRYEAPGAGRAAPAPAGQRPPASPAAQPRRPGGAGAAGQGSPADSASIWESLSRGEDPTGASRPAERP
jgi:Tryptophan-associated transmembrane protein (Trp_oprn_chp)